MGSGRNGEVGSGKTPQGHEGPVKDCGIYPKSNRKTLKDCKQDMTSLDFYYGMQQHCPTEIQCTPHNLMLTFLVLSSFKKVNRNG